MATAFIGETCALAAALSWAFALVLFKRSGEQIHPVALSLFKNIVALILLSATLLVMWDGLGAIQQFQPIDIGILLLSGVLGIAVADTVFFFALNLVGVGIVAIVDCLYSPLIILFSFLILSEELALIDYVGMGLILVAVFISSRHMPVAGRTRAQITWGVVLCAVAMALMTLGIVMAKPVLDLPFPLIWATTLRLLAGTIALALLTLLLPKGKQYWLALKPSPVWKFSLPASVLGSYLAMIFWVAGFKYAKASVAGILNQTSTIFAIILATLLLKETFTRRKLTAVILATIGVVLVTLKGELSEGLMRLYRLLTHQEGSALDGFL